MWCMDSGWRRKTERRGRERERARAASAIGKYLNGITLLCLDVYYRCSDTTVIYSKVYLPCDMYIYVCIGNSTAKSTSHSLLCHSDPLNHVDLITSRMYLSLSLLPIESSMNTRIHTQVRLSSCISTLVSLARRCPIRRYWMTGRIYFWQGASSSGRSFSASLALSLSSRWCSGRRFYGELL